ncbi:MULTISPECIES: MucB/RseB C-terminal domain-containing protein [Ralstonia solanacearum species complex]|uniref:Sugar dehydratase n=1 Tax=Ralstonia solanacearum TaxID=305 RepID=A0AA92Q6R7_RALSL|nr:MucB/RseB C-terminal domain-containing protein [Ralstonia pseudosolanacearum]QOK92278.1 sugar dehydratase [Ralstonia pseudosolanacearum]QOK97210.1 sugar dehydratase [Ralstonia pseudosolanacearum]UWD92277.1 MucB/RseB C-terminal domain-containing protein [Ralstonia pseudosolanacearum]CBJ38220.1 Sigma-E factor regulatory protein; rseB family [Ralstonia solanacearum CMR15]
MSKVWHPVAGAGARKLQAVRRSVFLLLCVSALSVAAQSQQPEPMPRKEAASWLTKIHRAALKQNYVGTLTYQRGSGMHSTRIQHYTDLFNNEYERVEALDGKQREMLRQNDVVRNLIYEVKLVVTEKQENKDSFPALLATTNGDVLDQYDMRHLPAERVAGMDCEVFQLDPKDGFRYAYRIWAERSSGLLIRAQTIGEDGKVLEQVAFSQVEVGVPSEKQKILAALKNVTGWNQYEVVSQPTNLAEQGWAITSPIKGFQKIREVRRPLGDIAPAGKSSSGFEVQQVVFSDGLAGLSLFIEPVSEKRSRREGFISQGATHVMVRRIADFWLTVVGEVPFATIKQFGAAVDYKPVSANAASRPASTP